MRLLNQNRRRPDAYSKNGLEK